MYPLTIQELEKWKCTNKEYLIYFLNLYYKDYILNVPIKKRLVKEGVEECIYIINNEKIYLYKRRTQGLTEYYTKSTWYLYNITLNFQKKESKKNFVVWCESNAVIENEKIISFLENYISKVSKMMEIDFFQKLEIYIIDKNDILNLFHNENITGFFDPLKNKIYIDCLDKHATHEICHSIMNQWGIKTNLFCNEGMGEAFKRPITIPTEYINNIKLFRDIYFSWNGLDLEKYGVGGLFFRYLYKEYGIKTIKDICAEAKEENCEKTEMIIAKKTGAHNITKEFVNWFKKLDIENEDWYFQYEK